MATAKEQITQLVQQQPDDSSYDEIIRELAFHLMIERGLKDSDEGRKISNEEMEARINSRYLTSGAPSQRAVTRNPRKDQL